MPSISQGSGNSWLSSSVFFTQITALLILSIATLLFPISHFATRTTTRWRCRVIYRWRQWYLIKRKWLCFWMPKSAPKGWQRLLKVTVSFVQHLYTAPGVNCLWTCLHLSAPLRHFLNVINYILRPGVERIPIIIATLSATISTVNKWW